MYNFCWNCFSENYLGEIDWDKKKNIIQKNIIVYQYKV